MTNAEFKKAAKAEGVKIYSLRKSGCGYYISYAYELSPHTVSTKLNIFVADDDLLEIFNNKFVGAGTWARF